MEVEQEKAFEIREPFDPEEEERRRDGEWVCVESECVCVSECDQPRGERGRRKGAEFQCHLHDLRSQRRPELQQRVRELPVLGEKRVREGRQLPLLGEKRVREGRQLPLLGEKRVREGRQLPVVKR